jgi:hypothetical protein
MRSYGAIGIVLALSAVASADAGKDVGAIVTKVVRATAREKAPDVSSLLAAHASIVTPDGGADTKLPRARWLYGADSGEVELEPAAPTVVVDDAHHAAWFEVEVDGSYVLELMNENGPNRKRDHLPLHVSGLAIDDHGWKIAALTFGDAIPDKQLYGLAQPDAKRPDSVDPRATSPAADALAHWIYDGSLAAHAAKGALANGTAPTEVASGAAIAKLAHAWDGLKMWSSGLTATTFAGGSLAFVYGTVYLPHGGASVQMAVGAVLVKTTDGWRWATLSFAPVFGA